ncbi:MAG: PilZ domain-containing protein [Elusimicrobia bacterium]|nr:PilZ domain-containing protein [Elusimicrobiota bacterium]
MEAPERRRHPRRREDAPLILIHNGARSIREGATLRDVSLGGLAFETTLPLEIGDTFEFAVYVPTRGWVDGTGRVSWTKPISGGRLCGASINIRKWDQERLLDKWVDPSAKGLLRFFFPEEWTEPPP